MRQLAVLPDWQGAGIGRTLVNHSEPFAREHGYSKIVLHARETAVEFYRKADYEVDGGRFVEVKIPHFPMRKDLL